jgi:hypothetical protein
MSDYKWVGVLKHVHSGASLHLDAVVPYFTYPPSLNGSVKPIYSYRFTCRCASKSKCAGVRQCPTKIMKISDKSLKSGWMIATQKKYPVDLMLVVRDEYRDCFACRVSFTKGEVKSTCSGCKKVRYCSKECQKKAWSDHKPFCRMSRAERRNIALIVELEQRFEVEGYHRLTASGQESQCPGGLVYCVLYFS